MIGLEMSAYFLSLGLSADRSSTIEKRIKEVVPKLVGVKSFEDLRLAKPGKGEGAAYVLVVGSGNTNAYFDRLFSMVEQARDQFFFILISDDISASDYKRLIRTGSADWVSIARAPQEISEIIARRRMSSKPAAPVDGAPPVAIAFVPSAGGVGNTTLVAEIGTQLKTGKAGKERKICAIDLDFQTSHLCDYLDSEPRLQIQEISANPERLDAQLFEIFISRHSSGLDVFAAPRSRFNVCDLSSVALDKLFDMISNRYELMLIDLPVTTFSWTADVVANCDGVLVTGVNTIPCLRQISETLATVRSYSSHARPIAVVINRSERRVLGGVARGKHVQAVLREEKVFFVSDNHAAFVGSANTGTPLSLGSSYRKPAREIAALSAFCTGIKAPRIASS
jgi:pilus assembly protein CpaE